MQKTWYNKIMDHEPLQLLALAVLRRAVRDALLYAQADRRLMLNPAADRREIDTEYLLNPDLRGLDDLRAWLRSEEGCFWWRAALLPEEPDADGETWPASVPDRAALLMRANWRALSAALR